MSFPSAFKIAESIAFISSNRLESRSAIAFSSVLFVTSVSVISRSARLMSWLQCPLYAPLTALWCFTSSLDIFARVSAPVSEISIRLNCVWTWVYSIQPRGESMWLVTYIMINYTYIIDSSLQHEHIEWFACGLKGETVLNLLSNFMIINNSFFHLVDLPPKYRKTHLWQP